MNKKSYTKILRQKNKANIPIINNFLTLYFSLSSFFKKTPYADSLKREYKGIIIYKNIFKWYILNGGYMKVKIADTFLKKLKGLMFVKEFNYILKIKCNGIHTFFMKTNIDVILTDKNDKVLYIYKNLKPNKIILPKKNVAYTYEMPAGYIKNIKIKETFKI